MATGQPGNGSNTFGVDTYDMGGWVRVVVNGTPPAEVRAVGLSHRLTDWFRQNPHLRLKCVVPITSGGDTVELHAWYEQHVFPDAMRPG